MHVLPISARHRRALQNQLDHAADARLLRRTLAVLEFDRGRSVAQIADMLRVRLARAARPEQRRQRAVLDVERDAVERLEVAEALRHAIECDHDWSLRGLSAVMANRVSSAMSASSAEAA